MKKVKMTADHITATQVFRKGQALELDDQLAAVLVEEGKASYVGTKRKDAAGKSGGGTKLGEGKGRASG